MSKLLIGIDFGSDSVRAVLIGAETGETLASHVHNYRRWAEGLYCDAANNQFRQHPLDYLEGIESVVRSVLKGVDPTRVAGIGIDTTGSTPCAVDREGTPLALRSEFAENPNAMFILWKDHTAIAEAARINEYAKSRGGVDYTMYEGGIYSSEWFWSKILHTLRTDPAVRESAFSWVEHCDWITGELCGRTDPLTMTRSRCAAGHKAMWHESWGGLPPESFLTGVDPLLAGLRARLYTETSTAEVPVGTLSPKWAAKLGLPESVVVSGSAFDCHFGAVGAQIAPYELVKVVGTSTCDILVAPDVKTCVRGICGQVNGSVIPGMIGLEAGQSAFGDVYAWFKRLLGYAGEISIAQLEREAAAITPGSTGILAFDWFNGRRTPDANPHLRGGILGLNLGSSAPMVYRALAESTVFGARRIIERFREEGVPVRAVSAIGGIARKSPFIMQMCADVFHLPIKTPAADQACALGGAMFAAVAAKVHPDLNTAMEKMGAGADRVYEPVQENSVLYENEYRRYLALGGLLEEEAMKHV
ncbi:ribulokinase [uncultured Victivallis sp.]|uniref:ribulokinase n=1 Tax=uncultured Victivallis sp. TaxID=354118 RepID=UPI0025D5A87F|nr:ribulokinase [uncultured Victivallis sp.]